MFIVIIDELVVPVLAGKLLTTLILKPEPAGVLDGIVDTIVPAFTEVSDPILMGFANDPDALLNCAVNTLPVLKVPVFVNGTLMVDPAQNGEPEIGLVVIVCENNLIDPVIQKRKKNVRFIVVFLMKIDCQALKKGVE